MAVPQGWDHLGQVHCTNICSGHLRSPLLCLHVCVRVCVPAPLLPPSTGKMWELWDEKINGDSETKNWMAINTKPCPKCTKPVEKNGGCNLVMCRCGQVRALDYSLSTRRGGSRGCGWTCMVAYALQAVADITCMPS